MSQTLDDLEAFESAEAPAPKRMGGASHGRGPNLVVAATLGGALLVVGAVIFLWALPLEREVQGLRDELKVVSERESQLRTKYEELVDERSRLAGQHAALTGQLEEQQGERVELQKRQDELEAQLSKQKSSPPPEPKRRPKRRRRP